jgi:GTP-dependent phosphoenolpyruvate carboxykinase
VVKKIVFSLNFLNLNFNEYIYIYIYILYTFKQYPKVFISNKEEKENKGQREAVG